VSVADGNTVSTSQQVLTAQAVNSCSLRDVTSARAC
jgi:hypothetical protein